MSRSFEDLEVFKRALELTVAVYRLTAAFPKQETYGLVSQLRRLSGSIVSHIAEGQGRLSLGEWRQMLSQARGSLFETEAHLIVARELAYIDDEAFDAMRERVRNTARPLHGLIRYVRQREAEAKLRQKHAVNRQP